MRSRLHWVTLLSFLLIAGPAWATSPTLIGYGTTQPGRAVPTCTVTPSGTIQTGDILITDQIAVPAYPGGTNNCATTAPAENWNCSAQIGQYTQIWWRLAGAADVAAASFTFQAENSWNVCSMYVFRGADQSTPIGTLVSNTGTGTAMSVGAVNGLPANSAVLLFENQDDANVAGFTIRTITPSGAPWTLITNFNGSGSPFSASLASVYQTGVNSTSSATATMSGSDTWSMVAVPILSPNSSANPIFATVGY